jgi:thiol-disulfide isomerase/thioredoxin
VSPSEKIVDYARGWTDLMKLVRSGHSWSGSERNRFLLNGGQGRFHEMSHLAGLDQIEDGRGLALVDWDHDGRLDLWYRNRSAPRLRLMLNRRESPASIAIKLEGTTSNRDGIGAVVELLPAQKNKRLVRSVKAGDLFLSQSSKWLHFGLGDETGYTHASVIWPGGKKEFFEGIDGPGRRFVLRQGSGQAVSVAPRGDIELTAKPLATASQNDGTARIILPARVPFPTMTYRDQAAQLKTLAGAGKPRLVILWSGICGHCKSTLKEVANNAAAIRAANLEVLALSVDGLAGPAADVSLAYDLIDQSKFPFPWGLTDTSSVRGVHKFQAALFNGTPAPSVPLAILLDPAHEAVAIYRGAFSIIDVLQDWRAVADVSETQRHHYAPPMSGTWFTNPLPQRDVKKLFPAVNR